MVAIQYEYQEGTSSSIGEVQKPKQNYIIPTIVILCLTGTFALVVLYFYHNEELSPSPEPIKMMKPPKRIVCYYTFPSNETDLQPENIDDHLCTHIIVGFTKVSKTHELEVSSVQMDVIKRVNSFKSKRRDIKVLISVNADGNTAVMKEMVLNHTNRKKFIRSVRIFLHNNTLDGIDLDWEYPNALNVNEKERIHFTQLLEEFRMHIDKSSHKFLLSVAVPFSSFQLDASYQIEYLNQFTDFINVMTYNFHYFTKLTPFTGLNSPLVRSSLDNGVFATLNINDTLLYIQEKGMDKMKINVGLPTFGRSFTLFNQYNNGLYSPAKGYGVVGINGFASFYDICMFLKSNRAVINFDSKTRSPYITKGLEWISFDDNNSLTLKAQFINEHDYGGAMIYSLNNDDFTGTCGKKFNLIRAVTNVFT